MTNCTLKILSGPENNQEFVCAAGETFIGRSQRCAVRLSAPSVSYEHAVITRAGDEYFIENLSANGTFVNNERITAKTRLRLRDQIRLGADTTARVTALPAAMVGGSARTGIFVALAVIIVLGIALLILDPFSKNTQASWNDWTRAYGTLHHFAVDQAAAHKLPVDLPPLFETAWRLEVAGARTDAAANWVRLHVLLSGRDDAFGLESASETNRTALHRLLAAHEGDQPPPDEELKAALLQFVTQMEHRK